MERVMISRTYGVIGLTCEHCVRAVHDEVGLLDGVTEVNVTLQEGGVSAVQILSERPVDLAALVGALDEAGDYTLAEGEA
jgi:copper chaperone